MPEIPMPSTDVTSEEPVEGLRRSVLDTSMAVLQRQRRLEEELKAANIRLEGLLNEKVALLKEVHHRVKNNLQVVTSLLRLEAGRSSQDETKTVLNAMQGRIRSMAMLHESLYRSNDFSHVNLGHFLGQLSQQAFRSFAPDTGAVRLRTDFCEAPVTLDQATPAGLLLNELISNSLKHGYPDGRTGELNVSLSQVSDAVLCLKVCDDGIGLPADFAQRSTQSLGLQLVSDLTRQLGGSLAIGPGPGAEFAISFAVVANKS